jgi:hypothetical protein
MGSLIGFNKDDSAVVNDQHNNEVTEIPDEKGGLLGTLKSMFGLGASGENHPTVYEEDDDLYL